MPVTRRNNLQNDEVKQHAPNQILTRNSATTCSQLNLPVKWTCLNCQSDVDVLTNKRAKRVHYQNKSQRRKCLQLWQKRWLNTRYHNTCCKVREFLNLSTVIDDGIKSDSCNNVLRFARVQNMKQNKTNDIIIKDKNDQTEEGANY